MSATRREWMSKLNKPMTGAVRGKVTACGAIEDSTGIRDRTQLRNVMVCVPEEGQVPCSSPLLRLDVRKLDTPGMEVSGIDPTPRTPVSIASASWFDT